MGKQKATIRRIGAAALTAVLLATGLAACGQTQPGSTDGQQGGSPYGKPWVSSIFVGNLPESVPAPEDDLFTHYAYDYLAAHQEGSFSSVVGDAGDELRSSVTAAIKDNALTSAEMEQLRIFYEQASDTTALEEAGAEELRPYLQAISNTKSLDELEAVLLSQDFPFSPWIDTTIAAPDMKSNLCVGVIPHMLFSDVETGSDMYQDTDDPDVKAARYQTRAAKTAKAEAGIVLLSIREDATEAQKYAEELFDLEKSYGKEDFQGKYLEAEYGEQTKVVKVFSIEELEAACPNFPMRATLAKLGEDGSGVVMAMYPDWLSSFNKAWTDENFEKLRAITELKVLMECADFIDPSFFASAQTQLGTDVPSSDDVAWAACDRTDTFSQLLAKTYVEHTLGEQAVDNLEALANDLIDVYIDQVGKTHWLNEQSRENVMDKIDNMALSVLYPDGGYLDYGGLTLTPTEEGGTLFGNYLKLKAYNNQLEAELVGQPAHAAAPWLSMRPTMQNCFYEPMSNSINIFPGFVTSALYRNDMASEELLAGMGFVIAHEISHAFDYSCSQFDGYGRSKPIFEEDDVQEFVALRQKLAERYSQIEIVPGKCINGTSVSAEAAADHFGIQAICERGRDIEGFDYKKMFGHLALVWAAVYPETYTDALLLDIHAPHNIRINASAQMTDAFYETYSPTENNTMYLAPEERISMWGETAG